MGIIATAYAVAHVVTPATSALARRLGVVDRPSAGTHKAHETETPYLGGAAILIGLAAGVVFYLVLGNPPEGLVALRNVLTILGVGFVLSLVGLGDDVRPLPRVVRLGAQLAAASAAWSLGFRVNATGYEWLNIAITLVWIIGVTNAFNLLDNMDGLSAGLAALAAASFGGMALISGQPMVAMVLLALAGSSAGFLAHNRHPAKAFMGDSGSLLLGFLLALLGIELTFENIVEVTFLVPVVVLGIPIFDTTLVVMSRLRHGRPVFLGGRDHVSHRLVRAGLPVKYAVGLLYWAGACLGWLGFVVSRSPVEVGFMLLGFVVAMALFLGAILWQVPVYDEEEGAAESDIEAIEREGAPYLTAVDNVSDELGVAAAESD